MTSAGYGIGTNTSQIGAPEVVRHDVKRVWIFLKLAKFYAHVDQYDKRIQNKYYQNYFGFPFAAVDIIFYTEL